MKLATSKLFWGNFRVKTIPEKFLKLVTSKFMKIFEIFDFSKIHFQFWWSFHHLSDLSDRNFCRIAKKFFLEKLQILLSIIFWSHKNSDKSHETSSLWIFFVKNKIFFLISSTIKLYWNFTFFWIFMVKMNFLKNRKFQKFSKILKLPTSNFFWK